eukprot:1879834-Pyramimonas_sp.AAC.1
MSPPCGPLSILQNLTAERVRRHPEKFRRAVRETVGHLRFCVVIARMQISSGRYFALEAPPTAKSWDCAS